MGQYVRSSDPDPKSEGSERLRYLGKPQPPHRVLSHKAQFKGFQRVEKNEWASLREMTQD